MQLMRVAGLLGVLALAACSPAPAEKHKADEGPLLLRAVYRDASSTMVLAIREKGQASAPEGDCTAPLLVDGLTGQVRVLTAAEVQARLRTMQLAGATRGACVRP